MTYRATPFPAFSTDGEVEITPLGVTVQQELGTAVLEVGKYVWERELILKAAVLYFVRFVLEYTHME